MLQAEEIPVDKRDAAMRRSGIVQEFEEFAGLTIRERGTRSEALAVYSAQHKIPVRTLQRWIAQFRDFGVDGLVDTRGRGGRCEEVISAEAFDAFKGLYLTQQRLPLKQCWTILMHINRKENKGWTIPSCRVMYNIIKERIPLPALTIYREGRAAYEAKYAPYIQADPDSVEPGQVWVGDHHQFNCWIRHGGRWVRPWITAWEDMRSRVIVGRHISLSPNQTTILLAMKQGIQAYGPPDCVKIDNGKDYDSEMWTGTTKIKRKALGRGYLDESWLRGLYGMMGIKASFAIPYHPKSKRIERWFDTLDQQFTKTLGTYCGKDSERKPDYLNKLLSSEAGIRCGMDLKTFTGLADKYIEAYNHVAHSGAGMEGRSPAEVLATRTSKRVIPNETLELLMRVWSGDLKVGKNGVMFKGLHYGQYNQNLISCQGKMVRLTYDPEDLRKIYVYDAATVKLITIAEENELVNYGVVINEEALRTAMRRKAGSVKLVREYGPASRTRNMDLASLAIEAMQAARRNNDSEQGMETLRPVRTPLDGQVGIHKDLVMRGKARPKTEKRELNIDLSLLKPKEIRCDLKLFPDEVISA